MPSLIVSCASHPVPRDGWRVFFTSHVDIVSVEDFDELIFPGHDEFNVSEPLMAEVGAFGEVEEIITKRHYEDLLKETRRKSQEKERQAEEWERNHPDEEDFRNPHRDLFGDYNVERLKDRFQPFNSDSVYYDEIRDAIERRVKYYNRIALIVQGLYDRSDVLHPHPPIRLWDQGGFEAAVELVYADRSLYHGEKPDFEAYRQRCNASLQKGSLTIGQDDFWQRREAERENNRWNARRQTYLEHFQPFGNPGPGYIAEIQVWSPRARKATFRWTRKRLREDYWGRKQYGDPIPCAMQVPADKLFNVSAYTPGDCRQFYRDPRTRAEYLQWAPLLIAAEEFHAQNLNPESGNLLKKTKRLKK